MPLALLAAAWLGLATVQPAASGFVGCYHLTLGPWEPKVDLGADAAFVAMPDGIRLHPERGRDGFEKNGYLLRSLPGGNPGKGPPSFWRLKGTNGVELIWTDGFTSVRADLVRQKAILSGTAETHWDFARKVQRRSVKATPVSCPQP